MIAETPRLTSTSPLYFRDVEAFFLYISPEYEKISKLLEGVQGPPEVQKKFVVYAMKEAAR